MATVTLSDENLKFLQDLMTKVNTQDNRCTASPYLYCVQHMQEQPRPEGCGDHQVYINSEGDTVAQDIPRLRKYLAETHPDEFKSEAEDFADTDEDAPSDEEQALTVLQAMDDLDVEMAAEDHDIRHVEYSLVPIYSGSFFTREACEQHIAANKHHYQDPISYVQYAFRNPELESVLDALGDLTGCGYVKH